MPTEILLMIMDCLPSIHVLYSFFGTSKRYHQIIQRYMREINLTDADPCITEFFCTILLPSIRLNIQSLILNDIETFEKIFSFRSESITQLFPHLKHFEIVKRFDISRLFMYSIQSFRLLFSLKLEIVNLKSDEMFKAILFCDQSMITVLNIKCRESILHLQNQPYNLSLTIRKLTVTLGFYDDFLHLLNHMPVIEYVDVTVDKIDDREDLNMSNKFHYLTEFYFILLRMTTKYSRINSLLSLCRKLERLSVNICSNCQEFIDGYYLTRKSV
ncbi:unnamed protein product [Didymodactylos carnosus]|uniref:F-box domain-containing protein n=1 Tax=Didymodactylos carnosus TaxID=1234261 RepID=A0A815PH36_9BILA|nr:unnamed protein product [Didymodactylos carnosus]CAF1448758.1 unnamed protein product [Didymodactylos carnosus]CAF4129241.1 unnamed protein product [Didymodactylos carnosus]CAF4322732.1 unnamed protein product [Didymodactylos carnosus]